MAKREGEYLRPLGDLIADFNCSTIKSIFTFSSNLGSFNFLITSSKMSPRVILDGLSLEIRKKFI